jgi:putative spermidine/putrescine transport system ATP-binding protein
LLQLTGGSIWLDERRIDELDPEDRGFGMVFQNYALFPHMSVRRNIGFGLVSQRLPKPEIARRVDEALGLVRLREHADKLPGQLSGGQQQRVAIARAIVVEPPLVLMDEPLSNLDAKLRLEMRAEIRRIHLLLGCSTIYVTHDQDEALSLADRIVVLRDGEVRQVGTPQDLYARPAHADVAEFMGYRNLIRTNAQPNGNTVTVGVGSATMDGIAMEPVNGPAVAAIRPDDLVAGTNGPIAAVVEAAEYRGRDFYGFARMADGTELFFRSDLRVGAGDAIRLSAAPDKVLVYAGDGGIT